MTAKKAIFICFVIMFLGVLGVSASLAGEGKINLNTATVEQIAAIEGVDQDLAEAIIELREENGEFVDMAELLDAEGMTPALLRQFSKQFFIEPASDCNC